MEKLGKLVLIPCCTASLVGMKNSPCLPLLVLCHSTA
nr:hypothetical protein Q903MT_gene6375 [Picea sitchensis]